MLKLIPYKIYFYGNRIEYKHLIHTHNKVKTILTNDISRIKVVSQISSFTTYNHNYRNRNRVKHYSLNIYTKNEGIITLNLLYENMGDLKQIADIVNLQNVNN